MSITNTLLLPEDREITRAEQMEAQDVLSKAIYEKFNEFDEFCHWELYCLLDDGHGQNGKGPAQYKEFIKWIFRLMLIPSNAAALYNRFGEDGGRYLENLSEFFESLMDADSTDKIWAFCQYYSLLGTKRWMPVDDLYSLWRTYVNKNQKTPKNL